MNPSLSNTSFNNQPVIFKHKTTISRLACLVLFLASLFCNQAQAQVSSGYIWSQSLQTYNAGISTTSTTPASIFSTNWDDGVYTLYTLPFNYTYNGTTYNAGSGIVGIDTDGWIAFGNGSLTMTGTYGGGSWIAGTTQGTYLSGSGNNNGFCAFNSDMEEQVFAKFTGTATAGSPVISAISDFSNIRVGMRLTATGIPNGTVVNAVNIPAQTITLSANATVSGTGLITPVSSIYAFTRGISPYRQFVVQWTRTSRYNLQTGDDFSFQIVLNEGGGVATYQTIQAVYGTVTSTKPAAQKAQVGMRGSSAGDFNARTTTTNWSATAAAGANTAVCEVTPTVFPPTGLTFTWSPPCSVAASNAGLIAGNVNVCPNSAEIYTIPGVPGAIFYTWTYTGTNTTFSGTTTLPTNTLNLSSTATGGTLTVTPGNLCGNGTAASLVIAVSSVASASISYPATSYCKSATGTRAPTLTGAAGGSYSASPSGLSISTAGVVTPSLSLAGTYTVTYTYTSGSCTNLVATTTLTIAASPSVSASASPAIVCSGASSQLLGVGEAPGNYTVLSIPYVNLAPTETTTAIFDGETPYSDDDTLSAAIALPFNFNFYGSTVTQVFVSENGYVQLQAADPVSSLTQFLPNPAAPNNIIALAWADLVLDTAINAGANVQYFLNGTAPNRIFVVEYTGLSFLSASPNRGNVTGQIRLYENDNHIEIALTAVTDAGLAVIKTAGIENSSGTIGISPAGRNGTAWNISVPEAWSFKPKGVSYVWSTSGTISNSNIQNPVATNITANTAYTVTVTDASTTCSATATVIVNIGAPLNGVYTVGASGNFPTLTAAINAYNNLCITGPVTFSLIDAVYSTNETFPITINSNTYASATKPLTIRPAGTVTITGANATAILKLNGADYVTIDGSKTAGGTTRDLTIINTINKKKGAVLWLSSASASNGATRDTIKNCNFSGFSAAKTSYLVVSSGSAIGGIAAAANSFNCYQNNQFTKAQKGLVLVGPTGNETGALVSGNIFGSTVIANKFGLSAIELYQQANCTVFNNTITGVTTATISTTSGISVFGTAAGIKIDANKISDIKNTNTTGFGTNGICLAATSAASNVSVTNNFISDVAGNGYTLRGIGDNGYGIIVNGGGGYFIDFNTVVLNTPQAVAGFPAALNVAAASGVNAITVRNNLFVNTQVQTGQRYAIQSSVAKDRFALIDNNDYYTVGNNLGYLGGNLLGLPNVTTAFGGNVNSRNIQPVFVSASDFHMNPGSNPSLTNLGIAIGGITTDIDTTTRNGLTPDMGADEWLLPKTGSWVGKTSTDWLINSNWETNKIPDKGTDVSITGGYNFLPRISTIQPVRNLNLSAPVPANTPVLTLDGGTLQVWGLISRTGGGIDGLNGTLQTDSTFAKTLPVGLFVNNSLKNLVINNGGGLTMAGKLDIYRSLNFGSIGVQLNTNDSLTFKSTATETAWLGIVTGKTIVGKATVERYIPTGINHGKSWQLLAVPVSGTQSVREAWQENNLPLVPGNLHFGTTISSEKPGATGRGYDFYTAPGPSMKTYNPLTNLYVGIDDGVTNTSSLPIENKKGYLLLVRGDRTVQTSSATATYTTLRTTGRLFTATAGQLPPTTTVLANKFETVGNPYPSAIDFTRLGLGPAGAIDSVFYLWDPLLAGSNLLGGYQTITKTTGYLPTPGSANYPPGIPVTEIQSGQAFYVHGSAGGTLSFSESAKADSSRLVVRTAPASTAKLFAVTLYKVSAPELGIVDGNVIAFDKNYSNGIDGRDARKIYNADENIGILTNNITLAVEARQAPKVTDTIFYNISNLRPQRYRLKFGPQGISSFNLTAYLADRFLNTLTRINLSDTSSVEFDVSSNTASAAAGRFYIVFRRPEVLPPLITNLEAVTTPDGYASLNWQSINAGSVDHFDLERSVNGKDHFQVIAKIPVLNNSEYGHYNYVDSKTGETENVYFRVNAVTGAAESILSNIVKFTVLKNKDGITVYPNPVVDKLIKLSFVNQVPGQYRLQLCSNTGQILLTKVVLIKDANSKITLPLNQNIASGHYQLKVISDSGLTTLQKLIIE